MLCRIWMIRNCILIASETTENTESTEKGKIELTNVAHKLQA